MRLNKKIKVFLIFVGCSTLLMVLVLFFLKNLVDNQNRLQYSEITSRVAPQIYQETETSLTREQIDDLNPSRYIEKEIDRLKEGGKIFWYDQNRKTRSRTKMLYLHPVTECYNGKQDCSIGGLEISRNQAPPEYVLGECDTNNNFCPIIEPKFSKELANEMGYWPEFYGFGKDIYLSGSKNRDDNFSIFKNEEEIFTHPMYVGTEGPIVDASVVLGSPAFTFLDLKGRQDENTPIIESDIWYDSETINEKYSVEASSHLFSYENKIGFVGEKDGKKFIFFNGQKVSQDFDEIRTHGCCAVSAFPIEVDENGILFFLAERNQKYFFVEANLNECCLVEQVTLTNSTITNEPKIVSVNDLPKVLSQLSAESYYVFNNIYPVIDKLPNAIDEHVAIGDYLKTLGFARISGGWGNWQEGPRMVKATYTKDGLWCDVSKYYYYNNKLANGYYDLKTTEEIVCRLAN